MMTMSALSGLSSLTAETFARLEFQQAVDGLRLAASGFGQAFGRPAGGRGQDVGTAVAVQEIEQRAQRCRLARARPAGEHGDFVGNGRFNRRQLLIAKTAR